MIGSGYEVYPGLSPSNACAPCWTSGSPLPSRPHESLFQGITPLELAQSVRSDNDPTRSPTGPIKIFPMGLDVAVSAGRPALADSAISSPTLLLRFSLQLALLTPASSVLPWPSPHAPGECLCGVAETSGAHQKSVVSWNPIFPSISGTVQWTFWPPFLWTRCYGRIERRLEGDVGTACSHSEGIPDPEFRVCHDICKVVLNSIKVLLGNVAAQSTLRLRVAKYGPPEAGGRFFRPPACLPPPPLLR